MYCCICTERHTDYQNDGIKDTVWYQPAASSHGDDARSRKSSLWPWRLSLHSARESEALERNREFIDSEFTSMYTYTQTVNSQCTCETSVSDVKHEPLLHCFLLLLTHSIHSSTCLFGILSILQLSRVLWLHSVLLVFQLCLRRERKSDYSL